MIHPVSILPGSFNPLTSAHLAMAHYAENDGARVFFEISTINVDKPDITEEEKARRKAQFDRLNRDLIFTSSPTFVMKLREIQKLIYKIYSDNKTLSFLIGSDTLSRIQDKKYYFDSEKEMERCLTYLANSRHNFIVFQRPNKVDVHPILVNKVEWADCPPMDISSTKLRNQTLEEKFGPFGPEISLKFVPFESTILIDGNIGKLVHFRSSDNKCIVRKNEEFFEYDWLKKVRVKL